MGWLKKPVKVKCYDNDEVAKLLAWMRSNYGLSEMSKQRFHVVAVMTGIFDEEQKVLYYEVEVPYYMFKPLREKLLEQEAFDPILEQRAFGQVLSREL